MQVFSSNSYEVRGGENRKWRWIFAFDRCVGKRWLSGQVATSQHLFFSPSFLLCFFLFLSTKPLLKGRTFAFPFLVLKKSSATFSHSFISIGYTYSSNHATFLESNRYGRTLRLFITMKKLLDLLLLKIIGHFRVLLCLCFKASLSAKPFL